MGIYHRAAIAARGSEGVKEEYTFITSVFYILIDNHYDIFNMCTVVPFQVSCTI